MNKLQKLIIILAGMAAISMMAIIAIFATFFGLIMLPLMRSFKTNNIPKHEPTSPPIENAIDAEFTRLKDSD